MKSKLLINLSNHPNNEWNDEQSKAAIPYGTVTDMQFPSVDPSFGESEIAELADHIVTHILAYATTYSLTVHVMGEMSLSFAIVSRLHKLGIPCVVSCSRRDVPQSGNMKRVRFHFQRFRNYCL